jgi:hypothetical protein
VKKKMNVKLLRKVAKHILEEPRRFRMEFFQHKAAPGEALSTQGVYDPTHTVPSCGTVACIAGWAVPLAGMRVGTDMYGDLLPVACGRDWFAAGSRALALNEEQADRLFLHDEWPSKFYQGYEGAKSAKKRAQVAAERIEHFIKTGGAE